MILSAQFAACGLPRLVLGAAIPVGSLADIIAVERVRDAGVVPDFAEHAPLRHPSTPLSFLLALAWLAVMGCIGV